MRFDADGKALTWDQACAVSVLLLRVKYRVSRAELARYLGISDYRMRRYERAEEGMPSEVICKLAGYFGVSADFFTAPMVLPDYFRRLRGACPVQ